MSDNIAGLFIGAIRVLFAGIGLLAIAVGLSALYALPVQWLVNYVAGGLVVLSFKKAWALSLLCQFLFKSSK